MSGANENFEMFEKAYAEATGLAAEMLKVHRDGDGYSGNAHLEGAWRGWNLHEGMFVEHGAAMRELIKQFFVVYRAHGIYRSPIFKYREDDFQKDARERMEKLFEQACRLVPYDDSEINRLIDSEEVPQVIARAPTDTWLSDTTMITPVNFLRIGESYFKTAKYVSYGYTLITGQHWFQSEENGTVVYTVNSNASDAEYVDLFVRLHNGGDSSLLDEVFTQLQCESDCPVIKSARHIAEENAETRMLVVRFMITHGRFFSEYERG